MIAITLNDPRESVLPECGLVEILDPETGGRRTIDTSNAGLRKRYEINARLRLDNRNRLFRLMGVDHIDVHTNRPYANEMISFFAQRRGRR